MAGLVLSVGGLTASVVKYAGDALLAFIELVEEDADSENESDEESEEEGKEESEELRFKRIQKLDAEKAKPVAILGTHILDLLEEYKGDSRVTVPVIKTIDFLCVNMCFAGLSRAYQSEWSGRCMTLLRGELRGSTDITKLLGAVDVAISILSLPAAYDAVKFVLTSLCHSFPKVRKITAEKLYAALLGIDLQDLLDVVLVGEEKRLIADPTLSQSEPLPFPLDSDLDARMKEISNLLTRTSWDSKIAVCRPYRNKLYPLLGLIPPVSATRKLVTKKPIAKDSDMSYKNLVREMGY